MEKRICPCGGAIKALGLCSRCYAREAARRRRGSKPRAGLSAAVNIAFTPAQAAWVKRTKFQPQIRALVAREMEGGDR